MNSGKTTTCRKLIKSFSVKETRIAACKLTGSVSNRDQDEMMSASPGPQLILVIMVFHLLTNANLMNY